MIKISVPATSANIGSGFDCSGIALDMHNTVYIDDCDEIDIASLNGNDIPTDESNLICSSAKRVYEICGKTFKGIKIREQNIIPIARGLGSSAACVAAGVVGANELLGKPLTKTEILDVCSIIEGHPDNAAPAIMGGFTVSVITDDGKVVCVRHEISDSITFMTFVPDFKLKTSVARQAIPEQISHIDARYNLSRSALLVSAFADRDYSLLKEATKDRLHQPYRFPLIPGSKKIMALADEYGALATFISGAGSSIMSIVGAGNMVFADEVEKRLADDEETAHFSLLRLKANNAGTITERE